MLTSETISALAGAGSTVLAGGATLSTGASDTTFSGVISGDGGLTKIGDGSFTLTGVNSFTGGLTVVRGNLVLNNAAGTTLADTLAVTVTATAGPPAFAGTLTVQTAETIGSLAGNGGAVVLNAALTTGDATNTTYSGTISGSGALVKQGTGGFTLLGIKSYSGGTTVDGGTLTVTTATLPGNVTTNATLAFAQAVDGTFAGTITGTGGVVKNGAGVLTLTGVNTFAGPTAINAGTLSVGVTGIGDASAVTDAAGATLLVTANETIGSLAGAGTVAADGFTLTTGGNNGTTSFSGPLTALRLTKVGTGTFTVTGPVALTGPLTVGAGTLAAGTGAVVTAASANVTGILSVSGAVTAPTTIVNAGATLQTNTGGVFTGNGTTAGNARLTIDGGSVLQGNVTTVATTTTTLTGTVGSASALVTFTNSGILSGTGRVFGTLTNAGTLNPGTSPGIINVTGAFVQSATGILNAEILPTAGAGGVGLAAGVSHDQVRVVAAPAPGPAGTAALAGTLNLTAPRGLYVAGTNYDIIRADGGVTGQFTTFTTNRAAGLNVSPTFIRFLAPAPAAGATVYNITVSRVPYATGIQPGASQNQIRVATGFQGAVTGAAGPTAALVVDVDDLTAAQARTFFDQASPEVYGGYATALVDQGDAFFRQVDNRLAELRAPGDTRDGAAWIRGDYLSGEGEGGDGLFASDIDVTGVAGGVDDRIAPGVRIGAALGYATGDVDYELGFDGEADSFQIAGYAAYSTGPLSFDAKLAYVDGDFEANRRINVANIQRAFTADFEGSTFKTSATAGYELDVTPVRARPFVGVDFTTGETDAFTEDGADVARLTVGEIEADSTKLQLGVEATGDLGGGFQPYLRGVVNFEIDEEDRDVSARFNTTGTTNFTVESSGPEDTSFDLDAALNVQFGTDLSGYVGYQGRFRDDQDQHGISGGLRLSF